MFKTIDLVEILSSYEQDGHGYKNISTKDKLSILRGVREIIEKTLELAVENVKNDLYPKDVCFNYKSILKTINQIK